MNYWAILYSTYLNTNDQMRSILTSLAALMSASLFVQFSNSAMNTLIPLKLAAAGQSESDVGIVSE